MSDPFISTTGSTDITTRCLPGEPVDNESVLDTQWLRVILTWSVMTRWSAVTRSLRHKATLKSFKNMIIWYRSVGHISIRLYHGITTKISRSHILSYVNRAHRIHVGWLRSLNKLNPHVCYICFLPWNTVIESALTTTQIMNNSFRTFCATIKMYVFLCRVSNIGVLHEAYTNMIPETIKWYRSWSGNNVLLNGWRT